MTSQPRLIRGILVATLGAVVSFVGVVVLAGQVAHYVDTARWPEYSLLDLIKSPTVNIAVPGGLLAWVYHPQSLDGLHAVVVWLLDVVPASLFFLGAGGFILRKALR